MPKRNNDLPQSRHEKALSRVKKAGGAYKHHKSTVEVPLFADKSVSQRAEDTLQRMDSSGLSSPDYRTKGVKKMTGLAVAGLIAVSPVGDSIGNTANNIFNDSIERVDANLDSHNLPPGGEPLEYRGGIAYKPGTDVTIEVPEIRLEP